MFASCTPETSANEESQLLALIFFLRPAFLNVGLHGRNCSKRTIKCRLSMALGYGRLPHRLAARVDCCAPRAALEAVSPKSQSARILMGSLG